jgi:UDP:flavonoid glycosyltransferase YjiC (YdhE family)
VAAAGAGLVVLPETDGRGLSKHLAPELLRDAIRRVLGEPEFRQAAAGISEPLRGYGGAPLAARLVEEVPTGVTAR